MPAPDSHAFRQREMQNTCESVDTERSMDTKDTFC
jgi:hypothetical protein